MPPWLNGALDYAARWLPFQLEYNRQPGLGVAIAHEGEVVMDDAYGVADLATGEALTPRHAMRIASHSKSFTAAGIMLLVEDGRLRLDDRCGAFVEGLHPSVAAVTIGQLLSHAGGIVRDGANSDQFLDRNPYRGRAELLADLAEPSPVEAGLRFKYSNHGYGLLGLVIEAVTGEGYPAWTRKRVVGPAGLAETWPDATGVIAPWASGHSGVLPVGRRLVVPARNPGNAMAAAAGFVSTASDLVRFFGQLDPKATRSILSVASRREMVRRHWRDEDTALERYYGLGTISGPPGPWSHFGHSGGFQGFISRTVTIPDQRLAIAVVTNAVDGLAHLWVDGLIGILRRFSEGGEPKPGLEHWTGRWWSLWGAVDLVPVGSRVVAAVPAAFAPFFDATEVEVAAADKASDRGTIVKAAGFSSPGEPARLVRDEQGSVVEVQLAGAHLRSEASVVAEMEGRYGA